MSSFRIMIQTTKALFRQDGEVVLQGLLLLDTTQEQPLSMLLANFLELTSFYHALNMAIHKFKFFGAI